MEELESEPGVRQEFSGAHWQSHAIGGAGRDQGVGAETLRIRSDLVPFQVSAHSLAMALPP